MVSSLFFQFPRTGTKYHLASHMESHLNIALRSLEVTQNQVKDQSKQIERLTSTFNDQSQKLNDQSKQIDRLMAKNVQQSEQLNDQSQQLNDQSRQLNDQLQQIACLTSTVWALVQQIERLKGQDQHQVMQVNETTYEAMGGPNKKGATSVKVKGGKFLKKIWCRVDGGCNKITCFLIT